MSTKQNVPVAVVQDYEYGTDGQPLANQEVTIRLAVAQGLVSSTVTGGAAVNIEPEEARVKTDANGFWSASLVRNSDITPGGTYYTVKVGLVRQYQIQIPAGAGPFVASAILLGALPFFPSGSSVAGPITITGNLSVTGQGTFSGALAANAGLTVLGGGNVSGGLTVAGGGNVSGGLTLAGVLTMSDAASRLVPGATSFSVRNNANTADNLLVTDVGDVTVRNRLLLAPAASKIVPGATSVSLRNNADNADNVLVTDAGNVTVRGTVTSQTSRYYASVFQSAAGQSIANNTSTRLVLDGVEADPSSSWSVANNQYTVLLAGRILVLCNVLWATPGGSGNPLYVRVFKNGAVYRRGGEISVTTSTPTNPSLSLAVMVPANLNDLLEIQVLQISGGAYSTLNGAEWTWAQFHYLGPL